MSKQTNDRDALIEALEAGIVALDQQMDAIREQKRAKARRLEALHAEAAAERRLATMSDAERAALAQLLQAEGIASGEAVSEG